MRIVPGGLDDPRVIALLHHHVATARAATARGSAHALDLAGLKASDISFWSIWDGEALLGVGALKQLGNGHGEVKSMHTAAAARRRGAASRMLAHIIAEARAAGLKRLSLETGSWDYFKPAVALYRRHGFRDCAPFAGYRPDPNSVFLTLELDQT
jgi:putative acetyltransferase